MQRILALTFCLWSLPTFAQSNLSAEKRVALIIGNSAYLTGSKLVNPVNDARAMAQRLSELQFDVILRLDSDQRGMDESLQAFTQKLGPGVVAVFFYAGHGFQIDGINYLLPIDFAHRGKDEQSVKYASISADEVLERMEKANSRLNLLVLDACRDNPFIARSKRSAEKGLAPMAPAKGTAILFATDAGKTADDNPAEQNGMFTKHLLAALEEPGLSLGEISEVVTENVMKATNGEQNPSYQTKIAGRFVFNPGSRGGVITAPVPVPARPQITAMAADRIELEPNQSATLRVAASDPNADPLQFEWSASSGRIEGRGETAVFTPGPPGTISGNSPVTITVTARNSRGLESRKEVVLRLKVPATASPQNVVGKAIAIGLNHDIVLEAQAGTGVQGSGVIEARIEMVDRVWQVVSIEGNFPGGPIITSVECQNGNVVRLVEQPDLSNGFLRARVRLQPLNAQQMTLRLRYQPSTQVGKKKR